MIIFHNPGLIPLDAIRLMGASVKQEGAFGRFGTGFKYAVATILRGGGSIRIWRGAQELHFQLLDVVMRGTTFEEVALVNPGAKKVEDCYTKLGFTSSLGKDWEPWMVLRELACNARDEGGDWGIVSAEDMKGWTLGAVDGPEETVIVVDWDALSEEVVKEASVFADGELLHEEDGVRVLAGPSDYLYHRGVRIWKLPKPSAFTYDIISAVDLTEDRTVKYSFCVEADVRNMILKTAERPIIAAAVTAGKKHWEGDFDWSGEQWETTAPGSDWLEEVAVLRAADRATLSKSALDVFLAQSAFKTETRYYGGSYDDPAGVFGEVVGLLESIGIDLSEVNVFVTDELPGEALSIVRGGSIYVTHALMEHNRLAVAREILPRFLEIKSGGVHDDLLAFVVPILLDQSYELKTEREVEEARAAGLRPSPMESFLGFHPVLAVPDVPADVPDF